MFGIRVASQSKGKERSCDAVRVDILGAISHQESTLPLAQSGFNITRCNGSRNVVLGAPLVEASPWQVLKRPTSRRVCEWHSQSFATLNNGSE
jgi:hypothetical protein